ncbi:MAG: dihydroorotate dehydrogenase (quinone) [Bacteroidia bacterium]|nr:MAG: dihydroorotate dehydrogenase (quinone) [Bacteroidia bacterium]
MALYRSVIRPLLFRIDPERIHHLLMGALRVGLSLPLLPKLLRWRLYYRAEALASTHSGIFFPNRVGLAAGFDKGAELVDRLRSLGFGFAEVGTVTPWPQPGNPRPRIFRLPEDGAVINRMGFNSVGLAAVVHRLARRRPYRIPIAGNIGKNTDTPNGRAVEDYVTCMRELYPLVDFFVVNVSCPNVEHLSDLQSCEGVTPIVAALLRQREEMRYHKPIYLKLGPDEPEESLVAVARATLRMGIDGFVLTNTTRSREGLRSPGARVEAAGMGGLSGAPLRLRARERVRILREAVGKDVPIIGVGGVFTGPDALEMLKAGASLVEIYTGFIYEGPCAARNINRYLLEHADELPRW